MIETPEALNKRLSELYGKYSDGRPLWRLVFSEDELEKRHGTFRDYTSEGFFLREVTEVREVPKYRQWMQPPRFVLERLTEYAPGTYTDQIQRTGYESVWSFIDQAGNPVAPQWNAVSLVVSVVMQQASEAVHFKGKQKYKDPREELSDPKIAAEARLEEVVKLEDALFGGDNDLLSHGGGVAVPHNYERKDVH